MELQEIKGIGAARAASLRKLGISSAEELIGHFPRMYQDRGDLKPIAEVELDEVNSVKAAVSAVKISRPGKKIMVRAELLEDKGTVHLSWRAKTDEPSPCLQAVWFNMPYMKTAFKPGVEYVFTGKVISRLGKPQMISPDYEIFSEDIRRIVPVYHATAGLSQKILRKFVKAALELFKPVETLDGDIISKYGLCSREYAVCNIHFPEDDEAFFRARRRLVFEELFTAQLRLRKLRKCAEPSAVVVADPWVVDFSMFAPLLTSFAFAQTPAQERVVHEIMEDMSRGVRMNRLIQGDVGSGKTLVAMLAAYAIIKNGGQAALMAPTEVLAAQHYRSFAALEQLGIRVALLTGSQSRPERRRIYEDIKTGRAQMIIGTHALIQQGVEFYNAGLVITDEQHRFGVRNRENLAKKGAPHVLVMTATPIPRSLALILYGDMDISVIDAMPPGRSKIETYSVTTGHRERLYNFIKEQLSEGRQAYIICPVIEDSETLEALESVTAMAARLKKVFAGYRVDCLHGRSEERDGVMAAFSEGEIDLLISTTVVEVGVNVPNATVMVIENAERFGLAQLHQLRGRVGRGRFKSYCVLITDSKSKLCRERLKAMKDSNDGFYISELDLKLRGGGDFFGTRQHGLPEFKIANLYQDLDILKEAQAAAEFAADEGGGGWVVI
ncbi:MAG: ATP-dependent DNA helicase RecG [Defluviitaleaceae bacterium]|nr:ATP-dependent DNA helicase RecG [Defluviitaleaceae bacterium]